MLNVKFQGLWIQTGNAFGRLFPLWVDFNFENLHRLLVSVLVVGFISILVVGLILILVVGFILILVVGLMSHKDPRLFPPWSSEELPLC